MPYKCLPTALKPILFSALFFMLFSFAPTTDETGSTLIGHWKLDEAAGTTLSDNSGLGNNAIIKTLNGIARVNGKYGLALDMPGTNNRFASTPNASALNITDKITITAWIRPVDVNSRTILSKTNPDGYEFGINNSGKIEFRFNATTNGNTYRVVSNSSYPVNGTTWMHVAVTFDGTASKIYVNGNLDVSVTYGGTIAIKTNTSPLYIGSLQTANRWRGAVDDIRIYRGALNASEIIQVMNNVSTAVPAAPVLLIPANTATNISVNPILNWNTVPSATSYRLEVSTLSNFSTTIFTQSNLVNTTQQVTGLLHETIYYWRIRGTNNGGDGAWSAVWSFTTALPAVPVAPILSVPANAATGISLDPTLGWNTVPGATSYRLEVSTLADFSTTVFAQSNLTNITQQVTGLLHEAIYYWRVRGTNNGGDGAWSAVWSFTTVPPAVPVAPLLSSPANASTGIALDPTLGWNTVSGATSYRLEVSTLADFSTTVFAQSSLANNSHQVTGLLNETIYYWRVRGTSNDGDGAWSAVWSFTTVPPAVPVAPILSVPANAATGISLDPTLGWNTVPGATSYRLEVSTLADFSTTVFAQSNLTNITQQVTGLLHQTVYYWRVRGTNNGGDGAWSAVWSFTTVPPAVPVAPLLSSPANASTGIALDPTLGWNTVPGATSYRLEVSTLADFSTTVFAQSNLTNITQQVTGLLHEAIYYWRVRGTNNGGDGAWSAVWSFTTLPPAVPEAPVLSAPANAATDIASNPTLSWNTVTAATSYRLEVSTVSDFSTTVFAQDGLAATSQQVSGLLPATIYYWRVRGTNAGGDGAWSAVWSFTTLPPAVPVSPTLSSPANAATAIALDPTLIWNTVMDVISYRLEVSTLADFSTTVFAQSNLGNNSQQVSGLLNETLYYWRVRGTNNGGDGAWSAVWSFTTATLPINTLTLLHYWNFNNTDLLTPSLSLNGGSMSVSLAALSTTEAGTLNEFTGTNARNGDVIGSHFRVNNPIGSTFTFNLSSTGYKDLLFKYETRRSTQGSAIQKISYSLNGTDFIFLQNHIVVNGIPTLVILDFTGITGANNNPHFKIKIEFEQGVGGTTGNNRFDNITLEGNSLGGTIPVPDQVITTAPANNIQDVILKPNFTWQNALNATSYQLQVATDNQFASIVTDQILPGQTSYKIENDLAIATNYFWRVRGSNSTGDGPWSEVRTFTTINELIVYKLAVNEVMSSNTSIVTDEDGSFEDWIEIVNYGTTAINLQGFGLSDTYANPFKWIFPAKTIAPGEFLIVWSSSKNRTDPSGQLHTSFGISSQGEEIVLTAPTGERVDSIPKVIIPANTSRGHQPDGTGDYKFFTVPTPGATNTGGISELITKAAFSQAPGIYTSPVTLALTHTDPLATIRYTLDGSIPTSNSTLYQQPFQLSDRSGDANAHSMIPTNLLAVGDSRAWVAPNGLVRKGTVIRAKAFKGNESESETITGTFLVLAGRQYTLPVISVVTPLDSLFGYERGLYVPGTNYFTGDDGSGNYYRKGDDWERPGSIEFFSSNLTFQQNLGFRINGDFTRRFPQKSLRLVAKSAYGPSTLNYPIYANYATTSFKRLELTNTGNDWGNTFFKDAVASHLVKHFIVSENNRQSIVYIDGEYWGIHSLRERTDKYFLATKYGVDPDNIDYLVGEYEIEEGEDTYYKELLTYVTTNDLTSEVNFDGVKRRMDIDNYLDYYSAEIFFANTDWPQSNIEYFRSRVPYNPAAPAGQDGRWRWILHDLDQTFGVATYNSIDRVTTQINPVNGKEWPNLLLRNLLKNQGFKNNFINRIADHLNTAYLPLRVNTAIDSIRNLLQAEVAEHILRWRQPSSVTSWTTKVNALKTFATQRPANLRQHLITAFTLGPTLTVTLNVNDVLRGNIKLNSLLIKSGAVGVNAQQPYPWEGIYFGNVPLKLKAIASPGFVFDHWVIDGLDVNTEAYNFTPTAAASVTAFFVPTTGVIPLLETPANTLKNITKSPVVFNWQAVDQATSYRLQVSYLPNFDTTIFDQSDIASTTANVPDLLDSTLYYWRVMAIGANGSSNWSATWSFTTVPAALPYPTMVTLATPAKNALNVAVNPTLTWNAVPNAAFYTVLVATDAGFDDLVVNMYNIKTASYSFAGLQRNTIYFWKVKATNERGSSPWSEIRKFTTTNFSYGTDVVGHWKMNEGGGKFLYDNSGYGNHAALQLVDDVDWLPAIESTGVRLLGITNMFGIAPNSPSLNITSQITIAAWMNPSELATRTILSKTGSDGYEVSTTTSGTIEFRFNATTRGSTFRILSNSLYPYDGKTWTHVACTYDGVSSKIYINGNLDKSVTFAAPAPINTNTSGLSIGALLGSRRWKGMLDDVLLYNRALSAAEIKELVSPQASATPLIAAANKIVLLEETELLKIYPNPVKDQVYIDFKQAGNNRAALSIIDAAGRIYAQLNQPIVNNRIVLNLAGKGLKPGIYFLSIKTQTMSQVIKLLKE